MSKCVPAILRVLFPLLFLIPSGFSQSRIDCAAVNSHILQRPVRYCVLLPASYDASPKQSYPVLYFLHGLGESEQVLFTTGGWNVAQELQQKHEIGDFLIVTPDGRTTFYINSADGKVRYSDFFSQEFIPAVENKYRIQRRRSSRAISGISMGGYGALRFAFAHPAMFSAVSAQSAALLTQSPQEMNAAMHSGTPLGRLLGPAFGDPIQAAHWQDNSVFELGRKNKAAIANLAIYFNCGKDDDFGFEDGATKLDRQLRSENIKHEFHLYEGDHGMSYFLSHLGDVMKFHSRQFGLTR